MIVREPLKTNIQAMSGEMEVKAKTWCCVDQGTSHIKCVFDKNNYLPGDTAFLWVDVDNSNCDLDVKQIRASLTNYLIMREKHGREKIITRNVVQQSIEGISSRSTAINDNRKQMQLMLNDLNPSKNWNSNIQIDSSLIKLVIKMNSEKLIKQQESKIEELVEKLIEREKSLLDLKDQYQRKCQELSRLRTGLLNNKNASGYFDSFDRTQEAIGSKLQNLENRQIYDYSRFICEKCEKAYFTKRSLREHCRKKHGEKQQETKETTKNIWKQQIRQEETKRITRRIQLITLESQQSGLKPSTNGQIIKSNYELSATALLSGCTCCSAHPRFNYNYPSQNAQMNQMQQPYMQ